MISNAPALDFRPSTVSAPVGRSFRYSPGILALQKLVENFSFYEIEERAKAGLKAIWGGSSWEAPLISTCGVTPINIAELWHEESKEAEAVGENELQIPPEFCSMIKVLSGRLKLREKSMINKILYFGSTCEPISTAFDLALQEGYDVHCRQAVTSFSNEEKRPEIVSFLAKELDKVAIWLTGKSVDEEKLKAEIHRKNTILRKIRKILDLRVKSPHYLRAVPTLQILLAATHNFGNPEEYSRMLDMLISELEEAARRPTREPYIPFVLAGGGAGTNGIINVIEESQGAILGWLIISTADYREDVPPLESIAHYVLDAQARGELGEVAGTSATLRRHRLEELVKQVGAKGIIASTITGCPYGSIVQQVEREHFKKLGIPIIQLESTVHGGRPSEEQIMRVRTFVEML